MKPVRKQKIKFDTWGRKASAGRNGLFTSEMIEQVEMLALLGATEKQIADFFKLTTKTIYNYANKPQPKYRAFQEALQRGKMYADMKVAQGLFKRATGFTYMEVETNERKIVVKGEDDEDIPAKLISTKKTAKYVPPDVKAAIHWLRNRQRDGIWIEAPYVVKHTGEIKHQHQKIEDIPVEELSDKAREMVFEVLQKQLAVDNREN